MPEPYAGLGGCCHQNAHNERSLPGELPHARCLLQQEGIEVFNEGEPVVDTGGKTELPENCPEELDGRHDGVENQGRGDGGVETPEDCPAQRRLAGADISRQLDETAAAVDTVENLVESFPMFPGEEKVAWIRSDVERCFLEFVKFPVHQQNFRLPAGKRFSEEGMALPFAPVTILENMNGNYNRIAENEFPARFMTITFNCSEEISSVWSSFPFNSSTRFF